MLQLKYLGAMYCAIVVCYNVHDLCISDWENVYHVGRTFTGWENIYQAGRTYTRLRECISVWENVNLAGRMYTRLGECISGWENVYHAGKISGISYHISSLDELIPVWENVYQSVRICTYVCVFKYNVYGICRKYTRLGKH